eukprot:Opistho-2@88225
MHLETEGTHSGLLSQTPNSVCVCASFGSDVDSGAPSLPRESRARGIPEWRGHGVAQQLRAQPATAFRVEVAEGRHKPIAARCAHSAADPAQDGRWGEAVTGHHARRRRHCAQELDGKHRWRCVESAPDAPCRTRTRRNQ